MSKKDSPCDPYGCPLCGLEDLDAVLQELGAAKGEAASLRTRLAEVEAERDAENALGNHLVAERDRVISEFDDALTTARGLLAEVETELARERDAHRLEKRAHEGTWNHKARVIDALTTARGLLGEVMSADDGYMLGKSLSARITAFLEGK